MDKMIAYCGLDCRKCKAYISTINDDQNLREETAKLWSELNKVLITPAEINCEGCRGVGKKTIYCERLCQIRQCGLKKEIENCGKCSELETCKKVAAIISNNKEAYQNLKNN